MPAGWKLVDKRYKWRAYCRAVALGGTQAARDARLCLRVAGEQPSTMLRSAGGMLRAGKLDSDTFGMIYDAIRNTATMYWKGIYTHIMPTTFESGWRPLGNGGHMRVDHRPGDGERH